MILAFGAFELDLKRRSLTCRGKRVPLLSRPFDILVFLIGARDRVVSRDEVQVAVWPGQIVTANNLTVQMSTLRRILAQHDPTEMIITVPGRGYRFIAEVVERGEPDSPARSFAPADPAPGRAGAARLRQPARGARSAVVSVAALAAALAAAAMLSRPAQRFPVHLQVETIPDTVSMVSGGYCKVDYVFRVLDPTDLQLATEDVRFSLTSGEPIGSPSLGGRIYRGSFPIPGRGTGVYHNNIWLPPDIAASVRAGNRDELYLRHEFHLFDPHGSEVTAPAVLKIVLGPAEAACTIPKGR